MIQARRSFQRGSVTVRNGRYVLRYRIRKPGGGWRQRAESLRECADKKAALGALNERLREVNADAGNAAVPAVLSFAEFATGPWRQYVGTRKLKPATRYVYDSNLRVHILPYFGTRRLDSVRPVDIAMFLASGRIAALAPKYQLNLYGLLRLMFGVAVDYELITSSPVRPRVHRPHVDSSEKPALSGAEVARVIGHVEATWRTAILCVALTGLRAGELVALQWKHVDLERRTVVVAQSLWRGQRVEPKTKASRAEVPVSDFLHDALVGHRAGSRHSDPDDYVFGNPVGRPVSPDFLRMQVLYPALERAGIPRVRRGSGLHLFRHTAASLVHRHTGSLKFAQALLRHARVSTTANVYTHVSASESRGVAQALEDAIFANCALPVLTNGPVTAQIEQA